MAEQTSPAPFSEAWYLSWFYDIEMSGPAEGVELIKELEQEIRKDERGRTPAGPADG